jgi:hypothetical protein
MANTGADTHLIRLAARHRESTEDAHRLESLRGGDLVTHQHLRGSAVGELTGVTGGDHAAFDRWLDVCHAFVRGIGADPFIVGRGDVLERLCFGFLVDHLHGRRDRHDLVFEAPFRARFRRLELAVHPVAILRFARDLVALGYRFGGLQHRPVHLRLVAFEPVLLEHVLVHFILHTGDRLDAAGDEDIAFATDDALCRERDRLQPGGAEAVHGHARDGDRHAGANRDLPRDIPARWRLRGLAQPMMTSSTSPASSCARFNACSTT